MNLDPIPTFSLEPTATAASRWESWVARLRNFLLASGTTDDGQKKAILLHCAGEEVFTRFNALDPLKGAGNFKKTVDLLNAHFAAKRNPEYEVFNFRKASQNPGENIDSFYARLMTLSKHCDFTDVDREIRSQIIQHTTMPTLRDKGLSDAALALTDLLALGRNLEATKLQSREMVSQPAVLTQPAAVGSANQVSFKPRQIKQGQNKKKGQCMGCGGTCRDRTKCRAWGKSCNKCKKVNHFASVCRAKEANQVYLSDPPAEPTAAAAVPSQLYSINSVESHAPKPYWCTKTVFGKPVKFQIDTGSCFTLLCEKDFQSLRTHAELEVQELPTLVSYTKNTLTPLGRLQALVTHGGTELVLPLLVVPGNGPNLLGRDWLEKLKLDWHLDVFAVDSDLTAADILSGFPHLFSSELGTLKGVEVHFEVDATVSPKCLKARPVPHAFRPLVEAELDRLVSEGVLTPVVFSDWATPIVPVLKRNGSVRICGDYKQTANLAIKVDKYPLPLADDLFTKLSGSAYFSKLDLSHAYQQLRLAEEARPLTTISTSKGLFAYTRLPFGISSAPALFQRVMEQLLQGIPKTAVYLDDILVGGATLTEHHQLLKQVLQRLDDAGLRLERNKCMLAADSVTYLGHVVDASGVHPTEEKIRAIVDAPPPRNVAELRSFLGLINFYHKFLRDISSVLAPLHKLLLKDAKWVWSAPQAKAFKEAKELLQTSTLLVHYDAQLPISLSCDASPYGVGAVLAHVMPDGQERPIAFASRTLSTAERNYAQIDREALSIVFGVGKFHRYLFGRKFGILTDHRPLLGLLQEGRAIPQMASGRMVRWALFLSNYCYSLAYRPGAQHGNADALSRLPLDDPQQTDLPVPEEVVLSMTVASDAVLSLEDGNATPVTANKIATLTRRDPILSMVLRLITEGWPSAVEPAFQAYFQRRTELSVSDGCILWGSRVVIPVSARESLLAELHSGHAGMVRMKGLARSYVWWPGCDTDIEGTVRACSLCCKEQRNPTPATLHPWEWPGQPWFRLNIDYAGPIGGKYILVLVDAHSKFIVAHVVDTTSTHLTLRKLRETFAMCGLPKVLVSDNGTCFTSHEFGEFCRQNGIKHIRSSPFHPSSNGAAERAVQSVKAGVRKIAGTDLHMKLSRFVLSYNSTPQSTTGVTPAELLMKRPLRTRLSLVLPDTADKVATKQAKEIASHTGRSTTFNVGDPVYCRNYAGSPYWMPGTLQECLGPLTFTVLLQDGRVWKRHCDQLLVRRPDDPVQTQPLAPPEQVAPVVPPPCAAPTPEGTATATELPEALDVPDVATPAASPTPTATPVVAPAATPAPRVTSPAALRPDETPRKPRRVRQQPKWQTSGEYAFDTGGH